MESLEGVLIHSNWYAYKRKSVHKERWQTCTDGKEDHGKGTGSRWHPQAESLGMKPALPCLSFAIPTSSTVRKHIVVFKPSSLYHFVTTTLSKPVQFLI